MASIYEEITAPLMGTKWEQNAKERTPYLGEALFPSRKQLGVEIAYLKGKQPKIRPLNLSSYDAKVIPLSREAFEKVSTEIPFFKNSMVVNEKMRQQLNQVASTDNRGLIQPIVDVIFDDNSRLLRNADVTREMLRMQLLTSGAIAVSNNGQALAIDFGVPASNKKTTNWHDTANADPVTDIVTWCDEIENATGVRPTTGILNRKTLALWAKADSVKNAIYVFANGTVTPNTATAQRYVEQETGVTFYVYDKGYKDETNNDEFTKFVADDVVVLFDGSTVGEGVFGTTPEESDLMTGTDAVVSIVDTGVAITTTKETDPVTVVTKVSMSYLPILTSPETLVIASVNG